MHKNLTLGMHNNRILILQTQDNLLRTNIEVRLHIEILRTRRHRSRIRTDSLVHMRDKVKHLSHTKTDSLERMQRKVELLSQDGMVYCHNSGLQHLLVLSTKY